MKTYPTPETDESVGDMRELFETSKSLEQRLAECREVLATLDDELNMHGFGEKGTMRSLIANTLRK